MSRQEGWWIAGVRRVFAGKTETNLNRREIEICCVIRSPEDQQQQPTTHEQLAGHTE
jgi:hypothetical protein